MSEWIQSCVRARASATMPVATSKLLLFTSTHHSSQIEHLLPCYNQYEIIHFLVNQCIIIIRVKTQRPYVPLKCCNTKQTNISLLESPVWPVIWQTFICVKMLSSVPHYPLYSHHSVQYKYCYQSYHSCSPLQGNMSGWYGIFTGNWTSNHCQLLCFLPDCN